MSFVHSLLQAFCVTPGRFVNFVLWVWTRNKLNQVDEYYWRALDGRKLRLHTYLRISLVELAGACFWVNLHRIGQLDMSFNSPGSTSILAFKWMWSRKLHSQSHVHLLGSNIHWIQWVICSKLAYSWAARQCHSRTARASLVYEFSSVGLPFVVLWYWLNWTEQQPA